MIPIPSFFHFLFVSVINIVQIGYLEGMHIYFNRSDIIGEFLRELWKSIDS